MNHSWIESWTKCEHAALEADISYRSDKVKALKQEIEYNKWKKKQTDSGKEGKENSGEDKLETDRNRG